MRRISCRVCNQQQLLARGRALDDAHRTPRHTERLRHQRGERLVRFPFHRRRGDAHLERFAVQPGNGAFLCPWLCVDADQPALVCFSEPAAQNILDTVSASVPTGISSTCAMMSTNSGDRSMFPIVGMKRRNTR